MDHVFWLLMRSGIVLVAPALRDSVPPAVQQAAPVPGPAATLPQVGARGPLLPQPFASVTLSLFASDSVGQRPRAIEYSDLYYTRLTIHKVASYATVPLFAAEYVLGSQLYKNPPGSQSTLQAHRAVAVGVASLFAVNTITGLWNLWDSRKDPAGRTRRIIHTALMIVADAGFVATGATAPEADDIGGEPVNMSTHRTIAIASMGTALASYAMMLIWKK